MGESLERYLPPLMSCCDCDSDLLFSRTEAPMPKVFEDCERSETFIRGAVDSLRSKSGFELSWLMITSASPS